MIASYSMFIQRHTYDGLIYINLPNHQTPSVKSLSGPHPWLQRLRLYKPIKILQSTPKMRYSLTLLSLATMVVAAPIKMSGDNWSPEAAHMRRMLRAPMLDAHAEGTTYSKAVHELASKMQMDAMAMNKKRDPEMGIANDINYKVYASYIPYARYGSYADVVEEAAVKTDMDKRDMLNAMEDTHTVETAKLMLGMERRNSLTMADNKAYSTYPSYPSYDPYGSYPPAVEHAVDTDMERQKRHDMVLHIPDPAMTDKRDMLNTECRNSHGNMAECFNDEDEAMMGKGDSITGEDDTPIGEDHSMMGTDDAMMSTDDAMMNSGETEMRRDTSMLEPELEKDDGPFPPSKPNKGAYSSYLPYTKYNSYSWYGETLDPMAHE
ncbi:hypothetical protein DE146DRAFT_784738 [Phaeosphaeria sp. MPI-PUGE-AT-0046c]|nr:hypothetical protein DE146DRAFT_784738 [Phaeosphaeria sp. MPI-PUGE-AT-0046c]